jgi:hypothetical protein
VAAKTVEARGQQGAFPRGKKRKMKPERSEEAEKFSKRQRLERQLEALKDAPPKDLRFKQTTLKLTCRGSKK